jgi:hypothetical protein
LAFSGNENDSETRESKALGQNREQLVMRWS